MDLEEHIFKTIYRLFERRSSTIFRFPVDPMLEPNYYEVIKEPMDISKIIEKLKEGKYALKE